MSHIISSRCVDVLHKDCLAVCPVGAIKHEEGKDRMAYIDPELCIDCRGCVTECKAKAILPPEEIDASERPWRDVNVLWFHDRAAARARVDALRPRTKVAAGSRAP